MPIVNEIDEENPKNNRTIDTDTGNYLLVDAYDLRDGIHFFKYVHGKNEIYFSSIIRCNFDENKNNYTCQNKILNIDLSKAEINFDLKSILKDFLFQHGAEFRKYERRGCGEEIEIVFEKSVVEKIEQGAN